MSKIICDVCGSAYSDTASQCPICGTARRDATPTVSDASEAAAGSGYTYVRGGRFSHANVRRHNSGKQLDRRPAERAAELPTKPEKPDMPELSAEPKRESPPPVQEPTRQIPPLRPEKPAPEAPAPVEKPAPKPVERREPRREAEPSQKEMENEQKTNMVLLIVVLILLVAVIFVGVYVVRNYRDLFPTETDPSTPSATNPYIGDVRIPCTAITLPQLEAITYDGTPVKLDVVFAPAGTTDEKLFASDDPETASVDENGYVTVHRDGQVTITVTCGDQTAELTVACTVVKTTDPTPSDPTEPQGELKFVNASGKVATDVTFTKYGEEYQLYGGDIDASLVTFTSSAPDVVTVDENGKIKVVGKGIAVITAQCGKQTVECKVICSNVKLPVATSYKIRFSSSSDPTKGDVTIKVGEKQTIYLMDAETDAPVSGLVWYTSMDAYISWEQTTTGVRITGTEPSGRDWVRVMCDYEGVTYTCIVRVREAPEE